MSFAHLHNHSYYSLMDGFNSPEELILRAKELGQPAMAITDHGGLAAHREFQAAGMKHGVKPILGVEAYISPTDRFDKSSGTDKSVQAYHHLIMLAKDDTGLKNIMRMQEIAWTEGYYSKPRIDREVLAEYGEGVMLLSGCMSGLIAKNILKERPEVAERWTKWFSDEFKDDFYMELQYHNEPGLNDAMIRLADKYYIRPVATSDCHFARPSEREAEEAMLILSTSPKKAKDVKFDDTKNVKDFFERMDMLYPERPISFAKIDVFVQSRDELQEGFDKSCLPYRQDIFDNSLLIADKVQPYTYHEARDLLPRPKNAPPGEILRNRVYAGLKKKGLHTDKRYVERAELELEALHTKGMESYVLIIDGEVTWARKQGIFVGPGRGSAAGSLIFHALGITKPDPIEENLLFTRFVNPGFVNDYNPRFEEVK